MLCPSCQNKGFQRSDEVSKPHVVVKTDRYDTVVLRYRVCLQCGYRWMTQETFYRPVQVQTTPDLFADGQ